MKDQNWQSKMIDEYLMQYYSKDSRKTAKVYLKHFFVTMNEDPKQFLKKSKKEIEELIKRYAPKIDKKPPKTQVLMLSFIRQFLVRHRKTIDAVVWENMRIRNQIKRGARSIIRKKTPTQSDLKKILSHATGLKSKAIFTLMASTGIRINEALKLTWKDIDMQNRQVTIYGEIAKGQYDRVTFFTPEAKEILELWKPERERLLQIIYKKSKYLRDKLEGMGYAVIRTNKGTEEHPLYTWNIRKNGNDLTKDEIIQIDNRVFPYDYGNVLKLWVEMLEKAGEPYNEKDTNVKLKNDKYLYNLHSLRRFWFTQMSGDRANEEYENIMGGHESELNQNYKDFTQEPLRTKLQEEYEKHIEVLSIFETSSKNVKELNIEVEEMKRQIAELRLQLLEEKVNNGRKH